MRITAEPRSDQINADDLVGGPRTVTVAAVRPGTAEQKYDIALAEEPVRVWRPPLTVLRLLIAAWGDDAAAWVGRRATLYRDPGVRFGKDQVGGIRVSHLSDLPEDKPLSVALTVTRGKRAMYHVEPLRETAPTSPDPSPEEIAACEDQDRLRAWWQTATDPSIRDLIAKRGSALREAATDE